MRFALVTPSYGPDFERCSLLCESVNRFAQGDVTHYVIVDGRDQRLFRPLAAGKVRVLTVESVLPWWIFRVPAAKRWWMSFRTAPIRNWVLQQLVKLSVPATLEEDVITFVDSDVTFVRPFAMDRFVGADGRARLARVPYQSEGHAKWIASARQMLRLPPAGADVPKVNYVGNFITWRRGNVLRLHERLRRVNGTHWIRVFCRHWDVSEYMLYGTFVEHVLGLEAAGHFPTDERVLQLSWKYPLRTQADFERFLADVRPSDIGIMIHSKDAIPVSQYRDHVRRFWDAQAAAPATGAAPAVTQVT